MLCNVCGFQTEAIDVVPQSPRESFRCSKCNSTSRNRLLIDSLGRWLGECKPVGDWMPNKALIVFEASGTGGYSRYLAEKFDYFNTQFDSEQLKNPQFDQRKYADLENLHFASDSIDIIITSDVFEHVRQHRKAFREILRVLKPDGLFLLQIPYSHTREKTITRVEVIGDEDIYVLPPVYHASQTLVYRDYGRDVLAELREDGFAVGHWWAELPELHVPKQSIIFAGKNILKEMSIPGLFMRLQDH